MSDQQLREAFALMKEGKKQEAAQLVREVLKTDGKNDRAWWMMVQLLDNEEKKHKAAERVLQLNPNHAGALKLLNLAPPVEVDEKKKKRGQYDWSRLDQSENRKDNSLRLYFITIFTFITLFSCLAVTGIAFYLSNNVFNHDVNGAKPEDIALQIFIALELGDFELLRQITCPELHEWVSTLEAEWNGTAWTLDEVSIDTSNLDFRYIDGESFIESEESVNYPRHLFIAMEGEVVAAKDGVTVTYNFEDIAAADGVDTFGSHVYRADDDTWFVCDGSNEYWDWE